MEVLRATLFSVASIHYITLRNSGVQAQYRSMLILSLIQPPSSPTTKCTLYFHYFKEPTLSKLSLHFHVLHFKFLCFYSPSSFIAINLIQIVVHIMYELHFGSFSFLPFSTPIRQINLVAFLKVFLKDSTHQNPLL